MSILSPANSTALLFLSIESSSSLLAVPSPHHHDFLPTTPLPPPPPAPSLLARLLSTMRCCTASLSRPSQSPLAASGAARRSLAATASLGPGTSPSAPSRTAISIPTGPTSSRFWVRRAACRLAAPLPSSRPRRRREARRCDDDGCLEYSQSSFLPSSSSSYPDSPFFYYPEAGDPDKYKFTNKIQATPGGPFRFPFAEDIFPDVQQPESTLPYGTTYTITASEATHTFWQSESGETLSTPVRRQEAFACLVSSW